MDLYKPVGGRRFWDGLYKNVSYIWGSKDISLYKAVHGHGDLYKLQCEPQIYTSQHSDLYKNIERKI